MANTPSMPPAVISCSADNVVVKLQKPLFARRYRIAGLALAAALAAASVAGAWLLDRQYTTAIGLALLFIVTLVSTLYAFLVESTLVASTSSDHVFVERRHPFLSRKTRSLLCRRSDVISVDVMPSAIRDDDSDCLLEAYTVRAVAKGRSLDLCATSQRETADCLAACMRQVCGLPI